MNRAAESDRSSHAPAGDRGGPMAVPSAVAVAQAGRALVRPSSPMPGAHWRPLPDLAGLEALIAFPIGAKELLNLAQSLPIAVSVGEAGLHVAAIVHPAFLQKPVIQRGHWTLAYKPLAVRALPFFPVDPASGGWRAMIVEAPAQPEGGPDDGPESGQRPKHGQAPKPEPFFAPDGSPAPAYRRATGTLLQLIEGARTLQHAAEALLAADLLAPLASPGGVSTGERSLLVTDPARLARLTPRRVHALARDGFLALDLLTASHFSQRLLGEKVGRASADGLADGLAGGQAGGQADGAAPGAWAGPAAHAFSLADDLGITAVDLSLDSLRLDGSPLFSIEAFVAARKPARDP